MLNKVSFRKSISFVLVLALCFSTNLAIVFAAGSIADIDIIPTAELGSDVTSLLTDVKTVIMQDGIIIEEGGTLDPEKEISLSYSFNVPVQGDVPKPDNWVKQGDFAKISLNTTGLSIKEETLFLVFGEETLGSVHIAGNEVEIQFDGDILNEIDVNSVSASIEAHMKYDSSGGNEPGTDYIITILDKEYIVHMPEKKTILTMDKSGTADLKAGVINWTAEITAGLEGGGEGKLASCSFTDDLTNVGAFVEGSFQIGISPEAASAESVTEGVGFSEDDHILSYAFADDSTMKGTRYLFFQTTIPNDKFYVQAEQTITNTASAKLGILEATTSAAVKYTPEWIKKEYGVTNDGTDGHYDPASRILTWTITVNQLGRTLTDATITDVLPASNGGLTWLSAKLEYADGTTKDITPEPANGIYELGTIDQQVKLIIKSQVNNTEGTKELTYSNTAYLNWDEYTGNGLLSSVNAVVGFNPISKSSGSYNASTHEIPWTVTVNTKGQSYGADLRVLDLMVYGTSGFSSSSYDTIEDNGQALLQVDSDAIDQLTPQYRQKYKVGSFQSTNGLEYAVLHLTKDRKTVADLLVVSGAGGNSMDHTQSTSFTYNTVITDPNFYAGNKSDKVINTASLFSKNNSINKATANGSFTSNMLRKGMLTREQAAALEAALAGGNGEGEANVSSTSGTSDKCFDYNTKSVIYRLVINANCLQDATKDLTSEDGTLLGELVYSDILPEGWEFQKLKNQDFLLYQGTGIQSGQQLEGIELVADPSTILTSRKTPAGAGQGEKLGFTFRELKKPYVIVLKARPTKETAAEYFNQNKTFTLTNTAKLENSHMTSITATANVKFTSTVLAKILDSSKLDSGAYVTWTVDYKPYEITHRNAYLMDTLPAGLDLRTDAKGNLLLTDNNIVLYEMAIKSDGTYTTGNAVDITGGKIVTYNAQKRELKLGIPDSEKGYRLAYVTDVTGNAGKVSNQVKLYCDGEASGGEATKQCAITSKSAQVALTRNGYLLIKKQGVGTGQVAVSLAGAEFALTTPDGKTVIRSGVTDTNGQLYMMVLPDGEYLLKETKAPAGYVLSTETHRIAITREGSKVITKIDGVETHDIVMDNVKSGLTGNLKVTKNLSGNNTDSNKTFGFTVTFTRGAGGAVSGSYPYEELSGKVLGLLTLDADGKAQFGLKGGESIIIRNLPKDILYKVSEADYQADGYTTTSTGASGVTKVDETVAAAFTNTKNLIIVKNGNLKISKILSGNDTDSAKLFSFTVTVTDRSNNPLTASCDLTGTGGVTDSRVTFDNKGQITLNLKGGQSATICKLPQNCRYTVQEADYTADGYTSASSGAVGTIQANQTTAAIFTNTKNSSGGGGGGGGGGDHDKPVIPPEEKPDSGQESGGGGGSHDKPVTPPEQPATPPEQPETEAPQNPDQPVILPITTGAGTSAPDGVTRTYPEHQIPNPGRADSPDVIFVIDEEGVPLGYFYKHEKEDGTFEYIDDEGVPLAYIDTPQTGDNMRPGLLAAIMLLSLCEAGVLTLYRKRYGRVIHR